MTAPDADPTDRALEAAILDLLARREPGKTICVSEAARAVFAESAESGVPDDGWRDLMDPARRAAHRLAGAGTVVVTQRGKVVDPLTVHGPIRIGTP